MGDVVVGALSLENRLAYTPDLTVTELIAAPVNLTALPAGTGYAYLGGIDAGVITKLVILYALSLIVMWPLSVV